MATKTWELATDFVPVQGIVLNSSAMAAVEESMTFPFDSNHFGSSWMAKFFWTFFHRDPNVDTPPVIRGGNNEIVVSNISPTTILNTLLGLSVDGSGHPITPRLLLTPFLLCDSVTSGSINLGTDIELDISKYSIDDIISENISASYVLQLAQSNNMLNQFAYLINLYRNRLIFDRPEKTFTLSSITNLSSVVKWFAQHAWIGPKNTSWDTDGFNTTDINNYIKTEFSTNVGKSWASWFIDIPTQSSSDTYSDVITISGIGDVDGTRDLRRVFLDKCIVTEKRLNRYALGIYNIAGQSGVVSFTLDSNDTYHSTALNSIEIMAGEQIALLPALKYMRLNPVDKTLIADYGNFYKNVTLDNRKDTPLVTTCEKIDNGTQIQLANYKFGESETSNTNPENIYIYSQDWTGGSETVTVPLEVKAKTYLDTYDTKTISVTVRRNPELSLQMDSTNSVLSTQTSMNIGTCWSCNSWVGGLALDNRTFFDQALANGNWNNSDNITSNYNIVNKQIYTQNYFIGLNLHNGGGAVNLICRNLPSTKTIRWEVERIPESDEYFKYYQGANSNPTDIFGKDWVRPDYCNPPYDTVRSVILIDPTVSAGLPVYATNNNLAPTTMNFTNNVEKLANGLVSTNPDVYVTNNNKVKVIGIFRGQSRIRVSYRDPLTNNTKYSNYVYIRCGLYAPLIQYNIWSWNLKYNTYNRYKYTPYLDATTDLTMSGANGDFVGVPTVPNYTRVIYMPRGGKLYFRAVKLSSSTQPFEELNYEANKIYTYKTWKIFDNWGKESRHHWDTYGASDMLSKDPTSENYILDTTKSFYTGVNNVLLYIGIGSTSINNFNSSNTYKVIIVNDTSWLSHWWG